MTITVEHVPERHRYEVRIDDEPAGHATYRQSDGVRTFFHTEVDSRFQGQGAASRLVRTAVEDTLDHALTVVPTCPYVVSWLEKHRDVAARVDAARVNAAQANAAQANGAQANGAQASTTPDSP